MNFIYFLKRYLFFIFISIILFSLGGFFYGQTQSKENVKATLFLTIATENSSDPEQAEIASTYFGETIMGWFRNPVFKHSILKKAQVTEAASISAQKQERQNMLIEIITSTQEQVQKIAEIVFSELENKISEYNKKTNSFFVVIHQGQSIKKSKIQNIVFPLSGALIGLILSLLLCVIKEFIRNEVSSIDEIEEILNVKSLDFFHTKLEHNDFTLLSVAIQKSQPLVILAGVNVNTDILAVALANKHSYFGEKLALVDGDLERRSLQETLGLSSRMKNIKGHTDALLNESDIVNTSLIIQNTLNKNLKFLPAGKGERFLTQVFTNVSQEMKTLIHTRFPENLEILRLANATLILVVHLGKTKIKDLKRIKEIWNEELKLVIIE